MPYIVIAQLYNNNWWLIGLTHWQPCCRVAYVQSTYTGLNDVMLCYISYRLSWPWKGTKLTIGTVSREVDWRAGRQGFFVCCCFTSQQHLRSNQDGYWLVTVHTPGECCHTRRWETRPSAPWPDIPYNHIIPITAVTSPCPILLMPRARLGSDKYQF